MTPNYVGMNTEQGNAIATEYEYRDRTVIVHSYSVNYVSLVTIYSVEEVVAMVTANETS